MSVSECNCVCVLNIYNAYKRFTAQLLVVMLLRELLQNCQRIQTDPPSPHTPSITLWCLGKCFCDFQANLWPHEWLIFFSSEVALRLVCLWSSFHSPLFTGTTDILIPGSYFSNKSESLGGVVLKGWAELKIPSLLQDIRRDVLHMVGNNNVILASIYKVYGCYSIWMPHDISSHVKPR